MTHRFVTQACVLAFSLALSLAFSLAFSLALLAGCGTVQASFEQAAPQGERIHVIVLHTNDVHGQTLPREKKDRPSAGGLARLAAEVNRVKAEAEKDHSVVIVVDAGDWYQGTPEGLISEGLPFLEALTMVGYDAMALGNHEFDFGVDNVVRLLREARPPAVCANLRSISTNQSPEWVAPVQIVARGGIKVAIVGLVTPVTPEMTHPSAGSSFTFLHPGFALSNIKKDLQSHVDWILPVTHLGVREDHELAKEHPDLPLIVGGHSHTFLRQKTPEMEGSTLIVQAGTKTEVLGRVDLWFDKSTKKCLEKKAQLVDLTAEPAAEHRNAALEKKCAELEAKTAEHMKVVVGELTGPLERGGGFKSSTAGNFICDVLLEHTHADIAVMNRGGIRTNVDAGPVTRRTIFEFQPFENNVTVVKMTSAQVEAFFRATVTSKDHAGVELAGAVLEVEGDPKGERNLVAVKVAGAPLDAKKVYRVAMNSFLADGGDGFLEKVPPGERRTDELLLIRDLLEQHFVLKKRIAPASDQRYLVKTP